MRTPTGAVALTALLLTGLTGCSDDADTVADDAADRASEVASQGVDELEKQLDDLAGADLPEVDWSVYGDRLRRHLDQLVERADCEGLEKELAQVEADDTDLTEYIKQQIDIAC